MFWRLKGSGNLLLMLLLRSIFVLPLDLHLKSSIYIVEEHTVRDCMGVSSTTIYKYDMIFLFFIYFEVVDFSIYGLGGCGLVLVDLVVHTYRRI